MITVAQISNFKGISSCSIHDTNLINLLIGKNNACKSTILEAMYYTLKEFTGPNLRQALYRRTNMQIHGTHLWYDYNTRNRAITRVNFDGEAELAMDLFFETGGAYIHPLLTISSERESRKVPSPSYSTSMDLTSQVGYAGSKFSFLGDKRALEIWDCINNCKLLDSSMKSNISSMERLFGLLKLRGMTEEFGRILNDIFSIGASWEFMNPSEENLSEFRAVTNVNGHRLYLDGLGDGMRYCIQIIGNMLLSNSTVFFVEEIENNQHEGSLKKLVSKVVDLSIRNNIQLFITTHDYQAWTLLENEFVQNLKEKIGEKNSRLQSYVVRRDIQNGTVNCLRKTTENASEFWGKAYEELTDTPTPPL